MLVRRAEPPDAPAVGALIARFLVEEGFEAQPGDAEARAEPFLAEPANAAFVADDDGTLVGVATVTTAYGFETGRYGEIEDLYVVPSQRSTGLGGALLDAACEWCAARGCHDVEIVVTPHAQRDTRLLEWYAARGFTSTGRVILERTL
jgi:GNAT superfamily N-acetyltransferase